MSDRFLLRLRVLAGVALVLVVLYAIDGFHDGIARAARAAWPAGVTLAVFLGWFGLEEIWRAGRTTRAGVLGALLFFGALNNMNTPSPTWSQGLIVAIALYALVAARRLVRRA